MEHVEKRQWLWMCGKYNMYYIECSFEMIAGEYNKVDATECVCVAGRRSAPNQIAARKLFAAMLKGRQWRTHQEHR